MTWTTDRYINLFTDFGFKKIFGEEPNKDLLIAFLNDLLVGKEEISDLSYLKNERLGSNASERKAIYDLYCTNQKGEKFIVEIQRAKQEFFKDRALYYSTFAIQEQAEKGKNWRYALKAVYAIAIMDFTFDDSDPRELNHQIKLMNVKTNKVFYDKLTFIYLEIPKFNKELHELTSNCERWLYAFRNLHRLQEKPQELEAGVFKKLFEEAEIAKLDKADRTVYQESLKDYWDLRSSFDTYFEEGRQEGIEEGKQVGIAEGIKKEKQETVINLFKQKLDLKIIAAGTQLTEEDVVQILKESGLL